jgi:beta-lactamase class D
MTRTTRSSGAGTTALLVLAACSTPATVPAAGPSGPGEVVVERPDLGRFFAGYDARGSFVLLEPAAPGGARRVRYEARRAATRLLPASTFKIFSTMAALEAGAVAGLDEVVPWDGVVRPVSAWNGDQRMREAFQRSTVWYYQELARRVGEMRMRALLEREGYGNRDTSGGVDQFWLTGGLRISADEQVDFLRRLRERRLGFPPEAMDAVIELMEVERTPSHALHWKTGWAGSGLPDGMQIGWLVGWVERDAGPSYFAMNLVTADPSFPMIEARTRITRGILRELGALPPEP